MPFSGGGYVVWLNESVWRMQAKFRQLASEGWLDYRTRLLVVEFTTYNAQVRQRKID